MGKEEAIIDMMVEFFIEGVDDEKVLTESATTLLCEDFGLDADLANFEAEELVDKLWIEADYRAEMANREAKAAHQARVNALMGALAWR